MKKPKNNDSKITSAANSSKTDSNSHSNSTSKVVYQTVRPYKNPIEYVHRYPSMEVFAKRLSLKHDANRTCHSYYRGMRLIMEYFDCDPKDLIQEQLRDYWLFVRNQKQWKPKSIRQSVASAKMFFVDVFGKDDWTVFSQIQTKDHDQLPLVLTRDQIQKLLAHIRLIRYRTPLKLIYCCGLRLSECVSLTIHDILGNDNKLWIRDSKGHKDRMVPIPTIMVEDLRRYWRFHKHPHLLFPNVGRGDNDPDRVRQRMHEAGSAIPVSSLQRLILLARKELNFPRVTIHTLRHSYATHLLEMGASLHTIQGLLGQMSIPAVEFVERYLRHVLPRGLRSIRHYGFCHPAAKRKRERIGVHSGMDWLIEGDVKSKSDRKSNPKASASPYVCSRCVLPMTHMESVDRFGQHKMIHGRDPPATVGPKEQERSMAQ